MSYRSVEERSLRKLLQNINRKIGPNGTETQNGPITSSIERPSSEVQFVQSTSHCSKLALGDPWATPVTIIHGSRPGPTITILGGMHGDELTGPSACTHLLGNSFTEKDRPLNPETLAGTIRIVPVVNMPGYRSKSRYFPDGRDLNRNFPGNPKGSSTRRVAHQVWRYLIEDSDAIIDLHSAGKGRSNMPQIRVDLAHAGSNILAKGIWNRDYFRF